MAICSDRPWELETKAFRSPSFGRVRLETRQRFGTLTDNVTPNEKCEPPGPMHMDKGTIVDNIFPNANVTKVPKQEADNLEMRMLSQSINAFQSQKDRLAHRALLDRLYK